VQVEGELYVGINHTPIQQALNFVNTVGGGVIFIEKGLYSIAAPMNVFSNTEIYGEGKHTILRSTMANSGNYAVFSIVGTAAIPRENIYIHDLFIGNDLTTKTGRNGIFMQYCGKSPNAGLGVGGVGGYDLATVGITPENKFGVRIEDCIIQNNIFHGININSSFNNIITNNVITGNSTYGINVASSNNNIMSLNTVQNNASYGIYLASSHSNNIINNRVQNNQAYGIHTTSSNNNTITGNTLQNNANIPIYLQTSHNSTVAGNTLQNNAGQGIYVISSNYTIITANTVQGSNGHGIHPYTAVRCAINGNTVQNCTSYGMYIYYNGHYSTALANICTDNASVGLGIGSCSYLSVAGNIYNTSSLGASSSVLVPNITI